MLWVFKMILLNLHVQGFESGRLLLIDTKQKAFVSHKDFGCVQSFSLHPLGCVIGLDWWEHTFNLSSELCANIN